MTQQSYSYSRISTFVTCPRQFMHKYILKDTEQTTNEAMEYGSEMHNFADEWFKGTTDFTPRTEFMRPWLTKMSAIGGTLHSEYGIGFNEDRSETVFEDRQAFVKGKLDVIIFHPTQPRAMVYDWKFAGKPNASNYKLEMDMFAMLTMWKHPEIESIKSGLLWMKTPAPTSWFEYDRETLPVVEQSIMHHIERIEDAICFEKFPCKPSGLCYGWCPAQLCTNWRPKKG